MHNEIVRLFKQGGLAIEWPKEVYIRNQVNATLGHLVNKENPDIVICYDLRSMVAISECGCCLDKVIVMFHSNANIIMRHANVKQKRILNKVAVISVLLDSDKRYLNLLGYRDTYVIGNVVPQFNNVKLQRQKIIICVGRLDKKVKRQHLLIEAFSKIAPQYPDWSVKFFGGDSKPKTYEKELQNLIQKNKLENQVFLMGKTSDIDVELKKASIFAFPSAYEGFPLALTEGMSMGLPAIGFKSTPAVNELIKDSSNGVLCDESVDALANALEELIQDEGKRISYGKQAKEDMQRYSADKIYAEWDILLEGFNKS